jgi:hypothetical protein
MIETGQKTKKKGIGFGGHVNNAARSATAMCTLGVSNLFWKKSKGVNYTQNKNSKVAICQECGNSWTVL